ncbi:Hsp70 family chaperone [Ophiocordyceps sinensis CO18]|uniref:Hsp70 family chaperone n=1 Tax=Ophiocordyceps sinensis (strain Co18 / CGMCC 3.14243) TaxID=911162 RepID=T5AFJ1_OPHSC|nr:Hsp70 family chaperone [Ophiocordyceps sinensis CO18]
MAENPQGLGRSGHNLYRYSPRGTNCPTQANRHAGVAWTRPRKPVQVINDWPGSGDRGDRRRTRCTTDYLREVYAHVKETVERQMGLRRRTGGSWVDMAVLFLFSVPTTWTRMRTINAFKDIVRAAGFGTEGSRHNAHVDLTEAEAAAVTTLKTSAVRFTAGSLFLTVDAGGGTTDLALMRITSTDAAVPQMEQVAAVRRVGIGSTFIDAAFVRLVAQRLAAWPDIDRLLPADVAVRMARSHHFLNLKHKFGESVYMRSVWKIPMDGVSHAFTHYDLGIENGLFLVTK